MNLASILLRESSVVSLRTAYVIDNGNLVGFRLNPADIESSVPKAAKWAPKHFEWVSLDSVWLYRHMRSSSDELGIKQGRRCVDQGVKPIRFEKPPNFELIWAESGNSVAVLLDGGPWAFIDGGSHQGYSKGIIDTKIGHPWNRDLFEKIFGV